MRGAQGVAVLFRRRELHRAHCKAGVQVTAQLGADLGVEDAAVLSFSDAVGVFSREVDALNTAVAGGDVQVACSHALRLAALAVLVDPRAGVRGGVGPGRCRSLVQAVVRQADIAADPPGRIQAYAGGRFLRHRVEHFGVAVQRCNWVRAVHIAHSIAALALRFASEVQPVAGLPELGHRR